MNYDMQYNMNAARLHHEIGELCKDRLTQLESVKILTHLILVDNIVGDAVAIGSKLGASKIMFIELDQGDRRYTPLGLALCIHNTVMPDVYCEKPATKESWVDVGELGDTLFDTGPANGDEEAYLGKVERSLDAFQVNWEDCCSHMARVIGEAVYCDDRDSIERIKAKAYGEEYCRAKAIAARDDKVKESRHAIEALPLHPTSRRSPIL